MSGKRLALILALALAIGLMGATKPRYGAFRVSGVGQYGSASPRYVTETWLLKMYGHSPTGNPDWEADSLAADRIVTVPLDSSAWDNMKDRCPASDADHQPSAETDSVGGNAYTNNGNYDIVSISRADYPSSGDRTHDRIWPNTSVSTGNLGSSFMAIYFDIMKYMPDGVSVDSAMFKLRQYGNLGSTTTGSMLDTLHVATDTISGDGYWMRGARIDAGGGTRYPINMRTASWLWQDQQATNLGFCTTGRGYPASANTHAWSPALDLRKRPMDWGVVDRGYVPNEASAGTGATLSKRAYCTRGVQAIIDGASNRGFWFMWSDNASAGSGVIVYGFGEDATTRTYSPYLKVTFTRKEPLGPWPGGAGAAFVFTSDAGYKAANDAWSNEFSSRSLSYTVGVKQQNIGGTNMASAADIYGYFADGMEIGSGGRLTNPFGAARSFGNAEFTQNAPVSPSQIKWGVSGYDSLVMNLSKTWIDSLLASSSGGAYTLAEMQSHPRSGEVAYFAEHGRNQNAVAVACSLGYLGVRDYQLGLIQPTLVGTPQDTTGDIIGSASSSFLRSFGMTTPGKFNLMLVPYSIASSELFGTAAAPFDSLSVVRSVRNAIEIAAVRHNQLLLIYAHDIDGTRGETYTISAAQMGWALDEIARHDVSVLNMGDAMRWMRSNGRMIYHPYAGSGTSKLANRLTGSLLAWWQTYRTTTP